MALSRLEMIISILFRKFKLRPTFVAIGVALWQLLAAA